MTAVARPGLQPLKIQQNNKDNTSKAGSTPTTLKASVSQSLANAQRATGGVSHGIMAQRTAVGSGAIFNVKQFNGKSIAMQRYQFNANRVRVSNNIVAPKAHNCNGSSNKFDDALVAMQILNKFGALATAKTDKSSGTKQPDGAGGTKTSDLSGILSQLNSAKTSGDVESALTSIKGKLATIETETPKLQKEVEEAKATEEQAKTNLKTTNESIDTEKRNVQQQEGEITKLGSQISSLETTIGDISKQILDVDTQIAKAMGAEPKQDTSALESKKRSLEALKEQKETELSETKQKKANAEKSKSDSEAKLKDLNANKEKYTKELQDSGKTVKESQAKLEKMQTQKNELENAQTSAEKKLETQSKKDKNSLDSVKRKLDGYANDFAKETNTDKKNKISEKYTALAKEFNSTLVDTAADVKCNYSEYATDLAKS